MAPDAIAIENPLPLRLLIIERNQLLRIVPIGLCAVCAINGLVSVGHRSVFGIPAMHRETDNTAIMAMGALISALRKRRRFGFVWPLCFSVTSTQSRPGFPPAVKFLRGSMASGTRDWGFLSHSSIHAAFSQFACIA